MSHAPDPSSIARGTFDAWIGLVRARVAQQQPGLLAMFDLYANEARFGRAWLDGSLKPLLSGARVVEVGGGLLLLSCQLVREGRDVTVIEPIGTGFSAFEQLQALVLAQAREDDVVPAIIAEPIEQFGVESQFDLAFSINVMEHVGEVDQALARISRSLKPGGIYRFTCPNYHFPYEPHFNIPIIVSKSITQRLFGERIFAYSKLSDPRGIWMSLNWINTTSIRRICAGLGGVEVSFGRSMTSDAILRLTTDREFAARRSAWASALAGLVVALGIQHLPRVLPVVFHPLIDCTVRRTHAAPRS